MNIKVAAFTVSEKSNYMMPEGVISINKLNVSFRVTVRLVALCISLFADLLFIYCAHPRSQKKIAFHQFSLCFIRKIAHV